MAKSLLSLSKMSHQSVPEGYVNAGLVPLNARPNTYPYQFSALSPMSSKPHTPTLTSISEQKERESVSRSYENPSVIAVWRRVCVNYALVLILCAPKLRICNCCCGFKNSIRFQYHNLGTENHFLVKFHYTSQPLITAANYYRLYFVKNFDFNNG